MYSRDGTKPDPKKVTAIKEMPTPKTKKQLQEFLGMINYLAPFLKNLSAEAEPLRQLIKKDVPFEWSEDHEYTYDRLKDLISENACLKYYDMEATQIIVDASKRGIGATLMQPKKLETEEDTMMNTHL